MKLVDRRKKLDLDKPFTNYGNLGEIRKTKGANPPRDFCAFRQVLVPYIVFLEKVVRENGQNQKKICSSIT